MVEFVALMIRILILLMPVQADTADVYAPDLYKDARTLELMTWHAIWVDGVDLLACAVTDTDDGTILTTDGRLTIYCTADHKMSKP